MNSTVEHTAPTTPGFLFGTTLAISRDHLIIGDSAWPNDPVNFGQRSGIGRIYAFKRNSFNGRWRQTQILQPKTVKTINGNLFEGRFSTRIALDGDTLIASAPGDKETGDNAGAIYYFRFNSSSNEWQFQQKLFGSLSSSFGGTFALFQNKMGVRLKDCVQIYHKDSQKLEWILHHEITLSNHINFTCLTLSIDESDLLCGGQYDTQFVTSGFGLALFKEKSNGHFAFDHVVMSNTSSTFITFIRNNTIILGQTGRILMLVRNGTSTWNLQQTFAPNTNQSSEYTQYFGQAITTTGDYVLLGYLADSTNEELGGAAYLYKKAENGSYIQTRTLTPTIGAALHFGYSVAMNDGDIAVSAPSLSHRNGTVFTVTLECIIESNCTAISELIEPNTIEDSLLPWHIALIAVLSVIGATLNTLT